MGCAFVLLVLCTSSVRIAALASCSIAARAGSPPVPDRHVPRFMPSAFLTTTNCITSSVACWCWSQANLVLSSGVTCLLGYDVNLVTA